MSKGIIADCSGDILELMSEDNKKATKFERYKLAIKNYILGLRDVRNVGMLAFVVLVLLVSWSGLQAIQSNFVLQKKMYELERTNEIKRLANENLRLTNKYYETNQYLEVTARQNLGMALPGETVLLVPKDVALKYTTPMPDEDEAKVVEKKVPFWERNFESWMNFFLHRG